MLEDYPIELNGTWKPYGQYVNKDQKITIQGHELTFWIETMSLKPKQTTVHFRLVKDYSMCETRCYNIKIDDVQFKNIDFMVHEESIDGKSVVILSHMDMEYDGRGRIVFFSYVREEDYALVNDEFKSLAYKYWNDRPSVPMMKMNLGVDISIGMMGVMMSGTKSEMATAVPSSVTQGKTWDCSCGNKQITNKFCPECGLPMSKQ